MQNKKQQLEPDMEQLTGSKLEGVHQGCILSPCLFNLYVECEVAQSCPTLCNPMDCSLPGSFLHVIFQARVLKWVAISFFRGSSQSGDQTWVSHIAGRHLPSEPPGKAYMQSTSCQMPGWMNHRVESRLLGETANSDMHMLSL